MGLKGGVLGLTWGLKVRVGALVLTWDLSLSLRP